MGSGAVAESPANPHTKVLYRTASAGPSAPSPDIVAVLDPASLGGGGPLERISTQRSARLSPLHALADDTSTSRGPFNREKSSGTLPDTHDGEKIDGERDQDSSPEILPEFPAVSGDEEVYVYPDGGYGWVVLTCCVALAGCTVGWGMNYGVFQAYYATKVFPGASTAYINSIGSVQAFVMNSTAFVFGRLGDRFGYKSLLYPSAVVTWLGIFLASRSTTLWQLFLTQGILSGIGQGMALPLIMSLPSQWFYKYRGFASGTALAGAGLGGGIGTIIAQRMIEPLGYQKTLMIMSFIVLLVEVIAVTLLRTRPTSPEARNRGRGPWIDKRVFKKSEFYSIGFGTIIAVFGYGVPWYYMQQWVELEVPNLGGTLPALPATLLSWFLIIGRTCAGFAADKIGPLNAFVSIFFLSAITQLCLWYTARTFAQVVVFSVIYGIVAPGYLGLIPQIVVQLFGAENLASNVGILLFFNGPGNLVTGILAGAIFDASGRTTFKWVIITDVVCQATGGVIVMWARYKASEKVLAKV